MRQRLCPRLDRPVYPARIGPALECGGLLGGLEAEDRFAGALVPPHEMVLGHLVVRAAAVVEAPVAGIRETHLVWILAVIVGNDAAVRSRHDARSHSAVPLLHLVDDSS